MKLTRFLAVLVAVATTATACQNKQNEVIAPEKEAKVISLTPTLYSFNRATDTAFEEGDQIGLHIITNTTYLDNAKYTYTGGKLVGEQVNVWYEDEAVVSDVVAYYPYSASGAYSANGYAFSVNANQTTSEGYAASDLMVAATTATPTEEAVVLPFKHAMSKIVVNIDNQLGEDVASVAFSDIYSSAIVNLKERSAVVSGSTKTIRAQKIADNSWSLIVVPQENVSPKLVVTTAISKEQYTFSLESAISFAAGKINTATVSLTKESITASFTPEITDWEAGSELNFNQDGDPVAAENALYLSPWEWGSDSAWFAAYFWNDSSNKWVKLADEDGDGVYECELPSGMTNVIFCRMNPQFDTLEWDVWENDEIVEDHVWNQTEDLTLEGNAFTITQWENGVDGKSVGTWDTWYTVD